MLFIGSTVSGLYRRSLRFLLHGGQAPPELVRDPFSIVGRQMDRKRGAEECNGARILAEVLVARSSANAMNRRFLLPPCGLQQASRLLFRDGGARQFSASLIFPTVVGERLCVRE
jgi:hypothetical protein